MSSNPLLGSRISLISKKNIRYEGTLYSINEADATVALQDVKSFGTEGRELLDATGMSTFVPPNDRVHAYLLFRGQDIKDLHVHEKTSDDASKPAEAAAVTDTPTPPAPAAPVTPSVAPTTARGEAKPVPSPSQAPAPALAKADSKQAQNESNAGGKKEAAAEKRPARSQKQQQQKQQQQGEKTKGAPASKNESDSPKAMQPEGTGIGESKENKPAPPKTASSASGGANRKNQNMVGTGASLLNRKARGAKEDKELMVDGEFDFESNLAEFDKANMSNEQGDDDDDANEGNDAYSKDDFFDTISSEATDRVNGIDNRLRGSAERNLNLDTFGAVSLGNQPGRKRYYGGRDGGRGGRGWRGGRGRGRGRGGGRGRDGGSGGGYQGNRGGGGDGVSHNNNSRHEQGGGPVPRQNNRWKEMSSTSAY